MSTDVAIDLSGFDEGLSVIVIVPEALDSVVILALKYLGLL